MNWKQFFNLLMFVWGGGIGLRMLMEYFYGNSAYLFKPLDLLVDWGFLLILGIINITLFTTDFYKNRRGIK